MKNVLLLLSVVFSSLFSTVSLAQTAKSISKDDALAIAQKQFVGKDVDYYILSNSTSAVWNIFVDAEPMKGWQHESINVSPRINGNDYTVVAMTNDGEIATESISLENLYGIQSISTANDNIVVKLKEAAPDNASVEVKNITDGIAQVSCQISAGANVVNFDGSNLSRGVYVVCYIVNSTVVDQQKIRIE